MYLLRSSLRIIRDVRSRRPRQGLLLALNALNTNSLQLQSHESQSQLQSQSPQSQLQSQPSMADLSPGRGPTSFAKIFYDDGELYFALSLVRRQRSRDVSTFGAQRSMFSSVAVLQICRRVSRTSYTKYRGPDFPAMTARINPPGRVKGQSGNTEQRVIPRRGYMIRGGDWRVYATHAPHSHPAPTRRSDDEPAESNFPRKIGYGIHYPR